MPHMIGYLAGDGDTMATRKAVREDIRLAVDFPDERRMLVACVMQNGDVTLQWCSTMSNGAMREMHLVGRVKPVGQSLIHHSFEINPTPTLITVPAVVQFDPLKKRDE